MAKLEDLKKKKKKNVGIKHKTQKDRNKIKNSTIVLTPKLPTQTTTESLYIAHITHPIKKRVFRKRNTEPSKLCVLSHRLSLYLPDFGAPPIPSLSFIQFLAVSLAAGKAFDTCEFLKGEALKKKKKKKAQY